MPVALAHATRWYGTGWLINRDLWQTADGWPAFRQFWWWYRGIGAGRAWDRLDVARAISLTKADGPDRQRVVLDEQGLITGD